MAPLAVAVLAQRFGPPAPPIAIEDEMREWPPAPSSYHRPNDNTTGSSGPRHCADCAPPPNAAYALKAAPLQKCAGHQEPLPRRVSVRQRRPQAHNATQYRNALDTGWVLVHFLTPSFPDYSLGAAIRLQNQPHFGLVDMTLILECLSTEYGLSVLFRQRWHL